MVCIKPATRVASDLSVPWSFLKGFFKMFDAFSWLMNIFVARFET